MGTFPNKPSLVLIPSFLKSVRARIEEKKKKCIIPPQNDWLTAENLDAVQTHTHHGQIFMNLSGKYLRL